MNLYTFSSTILILLFSSSLGASDASTRQRIVGAAYLDNKSYSLLQEMTDRFGGRLTGSPSNELSMTFLQEVLKDEGITTWREPFTFPGWVRSGDDRAILLKPIRRTLRAIALGYVHAHPPFEADVVLIDKAKEEEIEHNLEGKVGLVPANIRLTQATIDAFAEHRGLKGLLLINRKNGGQLLARTQNRSGTPSSIPIYSITEEEGLWLRRLIQQGETPRVELATQSRNREIKTANLVATLPGKVEDKIVIGAHFDSWDIGQGALDNGLGVAQAYDIIRLLNAIHPKNHYTVEVVWFNAEEFGLFGSYAYVERHRSEKIIAMINMDMVGDPIGINAMGFDALVPILSSFSSRLDALSFTRPLENKPWLGSDHMPFILAGIPAITLYAPIKEESSRFYHDFADTFDKVDQIHLSKSIAILTLLAYDLANDEKTALPRLSEEEVVALLRKAKLEERMKQSGTWPF